MYLLTQSLCYKQDVIFKQNKADMDSELSS